MRLIDADKLQAKHFLQRSEYPKGYEGTQPIYKYTDVLAYDIESAETVETIPIERIKDWIKTEPLGMESLISPEHTIEVLLYWWEKENENI